MATYRARSAVGWQHTGPVLLHPGVHAANAVHEKALLRRLVQLVGEGNAHANCQGKHARQAVGVLVVLRQPPGLETHHEGQTITLHPRFGP